MRLRPSLTFRRISIECASNGLTTGCLYGNHFGPFTADPTKFPESREGLPHPNQADATAAGIENSIRNAPLQLLGEFVPHGFFPLEPVRLLERSHLKPTF